MFDVCGTFFQSEAARRGGGIGGAVAAACLAHGRPPRVGCAHVLPAASPARASASTAQSYPCLPPAFSCAPPPAFPMRPIPAPARVIRTALSLRAAGFVRPPREGRILAGSQRVPCPPRHPARRPPPGFARPPRERRILEVSQRVPARRVALRAAGSARRRFLPAASPARASASTVQSYPCLPPVLCAASPCARRFFPAPRGKGGYWQGASACLRAASPCARPPAFPVRPNPTRRGFCPPPVFACAPREGRILAGIQRPPVRVLRAA